MKAMENQLVCRATWKTWITLSMIAQVILQVYVKQENKQKMRYLLGESLGGSIALLLHRKKPEFWSGAILVAPMCKIADDMRPPEMVITLLSKLCRVIPTWKIIPTQDIVDIAFKVPRSEKTHTATKGNLA
ncbi:hypothetical protein OIU74_018968 [Salix koriyanagi]|uniref:Serine aminopeptidase S33 domain-containing protein n=1 Tax=Salix koriyanagi TaxID=2511006 RepID=A0A9Q1AJ19_9ROSI|nr:hypothetical protein OIU74_018968 [Salix koriyanagi]